MSALPVKITSRAHGNSCVLEIDGVKVKNARSLTLTIAADDAVRMTVEYVNLDVEVDALIETTAMGSMSKTYKPVVLKANGEAEEWIELEDESE
jgi:hypothetical protein